MQVQHYVQPVAYLGERLVDVLKALGLLWQLLDNVTTTEHSLHVHPHALHHQPLLHYLTDSGQLGDPASDILPERGTVPVAGHAAKRHLTILQLLNQLCCLTGLRKANQPLAVVCKQDKNVSTVMTAAYHPCDDAGHMQRCMILSQAKLHQTG